MSLGLLAFSSLVVLFLFVMIVIAYKPKFFNNNWPVAFLPVFLFTCVFPIVIISSKSFSFFWLLIVLPVMIGLIVFASNITYKLLIHISTFVCFVFNMPNVISLDNYKASLQSDMEKLERSIRPILFSILEKIGGGTLDEIYKEVNKVSNQIEPNILLSFLEDHQAIETIELEGLTLYKYKLAGNGSNMKTIILDEE